MGCCDVECEFGCYEWLIGGRLVGFGFDWGFFMMMIVGFYWVMCVDYVVVQVEFMVKCLNGIILQQFIYYIEVVVEGLISVVVDLFYVVQFILFVVMKDFEGRVGCELLICFVCGVIFIIDGVEFFGYVWQVVEQVVFLEQCYFGCLFFWWFFGVLMQYYLFVVDVFVCMVKVIVVIEYEFFLCEMCIWDIIEDVCIFCSELGIFYWNDFNCNVIDKLFCDFGFVFYLFFVVDLYIFILCKNFFVIWDCVIFVDFIGVLRFMFDQGVNNFFYFVEEIFFIFFSLQDICVFDCVIIFNLMIGFDGYIILIGIISDDFDFEIVVILFDVDENIEIGWIGYLVILFIEQVQCYFVEFCVVVFEFGVELFG